MGATFQRRDPALWQVTGKEYILYLDANILSGKAIIQSLSKGHFKWLTKNELRFLHWNTIPDQVPKENMIEVDLDSPAELLDLHNDEPLASFKRQM